MKEENQDVDFTVQDEYIGWIKEENQDQDEYISGIKKKNQDQDEYISWIKEENPEPDFNSQIQCNSEMEENHILESWRSNSAWSSK